MFDNMRAGSINITFHTVARTGARNRDFSQNQHTQLIISHCNTNLIAYECWKFCNLPTGRFTTAIWRESGDANSHGGQKCVPLLSTSMHLLPSPPGLDVPLGQPGVQHDDRTHNMGGCPIAKARVVDGDA
eukprot:1397566-Rhodomonas_salina.1